MATQNNTNGPSTANGLTSTGRNISTNVSVKGDLIVGDGVNSSSILTAGSAYQVINANSSAATGLSWENGLTATNDNNRMFGYGNSVSNFTFGCAALPIFSTQALVANTLYFIPFNIYKSTTFSKIGMEITTGAASSNIRLGIYNCDNNFGYPGSLVLDAGTIDSSTLGNKTITISQNLLDKYMLCFISNGTPTVRSSYQIGPPYQETNAFWGINTTGGTTNCTSCSIASVSSYYTSLPSSVIGNAITKTNAFHLVYLQV